MINLETGEITLIDSKIVLCRDLHSDTFRIKAKDLIVRKSHYDTGYDSYFCWGDIEQGSYIYFVSHFYNNLLFEIQMMPQHHCTIPHGVPICSECKLDWEEVLVWYRKYFPEGIQKYPWGEVVFFKGTDSIYHPTHIRIKYS